MRIKLIFSVIIVTAVALAGLAQSANVRAQDGGVPDDYETVAADVAWSDNVSVSFEDGNMIFTSDGLPSHGWLDAYQGLGQSGVIDNAVQEQNYNYTITMNPTFADSPTTTPLGPIGVAVSGAVFFNPYEADNTTLALDDNFEINGIPFIDACGGHPEPNRGMYHYHNVPYCITDVLDTPGEHSVIIGYLFDGFPVYGPQDTDGEAPTDLDECSGHFGPTPEFPDGVYHYHLTNTAPYSITCYRGEVSVTTPGGQAGDQGTQGQAPQGTPPQGTPPQDGRGGGRPPRQ